MNVSSPMFREASGDFRLDISNLQKGIVLVYLSFIHNDWALSRLPVRLGHEPAAQLIHVPDAHYVLHMALPCVCDRAITAQHGLRDLTPHHRPGHLLFNLTQCAGKYSHNGQSNDRSWGSLPQKQLWGFFPSWFCQRVQLKCSLRWMQIHTISVTFASARQECLPSLIMQAMQTIKLFHVSQRVQIAVRDRSQRLTSHTKMTSWLVRLTSQYRFNYKDGWIDRWIRTRIFISLNVIFKNVL